MIMAARDPDLAACQTALSLGVVGRQSLEKHGTDDRLALAAAIVFPGKWRTGSQNGFARHAGHDLMGRKHILEDGIGTAQAAESFGVRGFARIAHARHSGTSFLAATPSRSRPSRRLGYRLIGRLTSIDRLINICNDAGQVGIEGDGKDRRTGGKEFQASREERGDAAAYRGIAQTFG